MDFITVIYPKYVISLVCFFNVLTGCTDWFLKLSLNVPLLKYTNTIWHVWRQNNNQSNCYHYITFCKLSLAILVGTLADVTDVSSGTNLSTAHLSLLNHNCIPGRTITGSEAQLNWTTLPECGWKPKGTDTSLWDLWRPIHHLGHLQLLNNDNSYFWDEMTQQNDEIYMTISWGHLAELLACWHQI